MNGIQLKCRVEKDLYLDFEDYRQYTCVNCYNQVPRDSFRRKLIYRRGASASQAPSLHEWSSDRPVELANETHSLIRSTFKDEAIFDKWQACCRHALQCCLDNSRSLRARINEQTMQLEDEPLPRAHCPATWDGLTCWPESGAGQAAWRECPRHVYLLSFEPACAGYVTKQCFANGTWFIRNGHEWSDYSQCPNLPVYAKRMQFSALWHIVSALVITPALLTIDKFSNRGGNKRVKILRTLLFWLLVNSCIQATQKAAIVGGLFEADSSRGRGSDGSLSAGANRSAQVVPLAGAAPSIGQQSAPALANAQAPLSSAESERAHLANKSSDRLAKLVDQSQLGQDTSHLRARARSDSNQVRRSVKSAGETALERGPLDFDDEDREDAYRTDLPPPPTPTPHKSAGAPLAASLEIVALQQASQTRPGEMRKADSRPLKFEAGQREQSNNSSDKTDSSAAPANPLTVAPSQTVARCKRQNAPDQRQQQQQQQPTAGRQRRRSALITFFCWFLVVASRLVRLMGYSWMFTGAIYLCSALHFAPAEPPAAFIRILMILTNAFPIVIAFIYITSRTIVEPSPLNIIFKVPYYKLIGDHESVEEMWQTQLECWFDQSRYESIEDIADLPNLILICLNVGLFVITLIILCRISRPGSTRPDMSPLTYFKAAGTLVVLYGGHYALLAYRPNSESCLLDTFMFYSFLFVDGIQGVAVSYVFCYRTPEGKTIIKKYWDNKRDIIQIKL